METITEILPLLIGEPTTTFQSDVQYTIASLITVICIMFFLKLFLLIGGYLSPNNR